jgi:hypothetical protein
MIGRHARRFPFGLSVIGRPRLGVVGSGAVEFDEDRLVRRDAERAAFTPLVAGHVEGVLSFADKDAGCACGVRVVDCLFSERQQRQSSLVALPGHRVNAAQVDPGVGERFVPRAARHAHRHGRRRIPEAHRRLAPTAVSILEAEVAELKVRLAALKPKTKQ